MTQSIFEEFYSVDKADKEYYLMPIAIIPFGSGKYALKNYSNNAKKEAKMNNVLTNTLKAMQKVYNVNYSLNSSSDFKTSDRHFDLLLDKSKFICSFEILSYIVLGFVFNIDEIVFVVRKKAVYTSNKMEQLYVNWIKNKYSFITKKLKKILEFFYRTYKFNFYKIVSETEYFKTQYDYAFFIVYTNADSKDSYKNYINSLLDPTQVIYYHDEIKQIKNSIIEHRIRNIKTNGENKFDIEKRSDYRVYFSWSTGLIEGKFSLQEFFEYILIEVELQNKWNEINKLTNIFRNKNMKITLQTELKLTKLEIFAVQLNSLHDAGDSERILNLKEKIIQSSRIQNLIMELRKLLSLNQQLNTKYISLIAVGISILTLILTITLN